MKDKYKWGELTEPEILSCHIPKSSFVFTPSFLETNIWPVDCSSLENLKHAEYIEIDQYGYSLPVWGKFSVKTTPVLH